MAADIYTTPAARSVLDALERLHRAGWSVGDAQLDGPGGRRWVVGGTNGEKAIRAEGRSEAEAWRAAVEQARAVGMLGPWIVHRDIWGVP
jgi:hypothetical protein